MRPRDHLTAEQDQLRLFWDAFVSGEATADEALPRETTKTVRALHEFDDVPGPDPQLVARIWADALRRAGTDAQPAAAPAANRSLARRVVDAVNSAQPALRALHAAMLAGAVAGALTLGLGLRAAMRIAGFLTEPAERGLLTEAGNRVGQITVAGTIFIVIMGAVLGVAGGVAYAIVRPWLPWSGWRRGLLFGVALFAVGGSSLYEHGRNPDYREFGIAGVNVCLFGVLPILYGLVAAPLTDRIQAAFARRSGIAPAHPKLATARRALGFAAVAVFLVLGILAAPPLIALVALAVFRAGLVRAVGRFESPTDLLRRPVIAVPAYAVVVLPCLVGLLLTLQAVERILV